MDIERNKLTALFEIRPTSEVSRAKGGVFPKGRILLGRSESCDLMANHDSVSAVHAVLEIFDDRAVLYDMNSTNGTFVNGDKVVKKEIHVGDRIRLADVEFEFLKYVSAAATLPPVLDALEPASGAASVRVPPAPPAAPTETKGLPQTAPQVADQIPSVVYPLAADPRAEFSEYIFRQAIAVSVVGHVFPRRNPALNSYAAQRLFYIVFIKRNHMGDLGHIECIHAFVVEIITQQQHK